VKSNNNSTHTKDTVEKETKKNTREAPNILQTSAITKGQKQITRIICGVNKKKEEKET
jgi:hypothetical protein